MCDRDCFNCSLKDCVNDDLTAEERKAQDELDTEIIVSRKNRQQLVMWKHWHSEKGKATMRRYNASEKGKERQKRYLKTEKGKQQIKRKRERKIASGKNAEYCRTYYQRQKAKKLQEATA